MGQKMVFANLLANQFCKISKKVSEIALSRSTQCQLFPNNSKIVAENVQPMMFLKGEEKEKPDSAGVLTTLAALS